MAYDREQLKVSMIFSVLNTEEVAITSFSITGAAFDAEAALAAAVGRVSGPVVYNAYATFMTTGGILWASYSRLTDVKIAALDTQGLYITDAVVWNDSVPGGGITEQVLPQSTVVASLRTNSVLGDANYGRMYLPHTKLELATGFATANTSVTNSVRTGLVTFLDAMNNEFNQGVQPGVISIMSSKGAGISKGVTRCAIGSVTDTQRRRRNRIPEVYSFGNVTP